LKITLLIGGLLFFACFGFTQKFDMQIGFNYAIPKYDNFFQDGFESRPGLALRFRSVKSGQLKFGGLFEYNKFMPKVDNLIDVNQAFMVTFNFLVNYDLLKNKRNSLEPILEFGFNFLNYDKGDFNGSGFGLSPGINYRIMADDDYGIEFTFLLKNVFDEFGRDKNPAEANSFQLIQLRLGVTFNIN
jgi:hypothetical protein